MFGARLMLQTYEAGVGVPGGTSRRGWRRGIGPMRSDEGLESGSRSMLTMMTLQGCRGCTARGMHAWMSAGDFELTRREYTTVAVEDAGVEPIPGMG